MDDFPAINGWAIIKGVLPEKSLMNRVLVEIAQ